ncbi:MAG: CLN3 protein-domain-containing protein [Benniella sp.]|nr:MAG: CLN3 protein-domain-containing protein [Benniella sp.]
MPPAWLTRGTGYASIPDDQDARPPRIRLHRDWIAFFIFGCINNLIYVVILSAAVDLVGAKVPKGVVLLADIAPSLLAKMTAPYFIHRVPYPVRVMFCASLSFSAVVLIALANSISVRLLGVMMASLSSGLGELTFLMLSSFYRLQMVSAWSSGTGGAGLLGALLFLALTSWIGLSIPTTLGIVALFPVLMLVAYFIILSPPSSQNSRHHAAGYRPISSSSAQFSGRNSDYNTNNHNFEEEFLASPEESHLRPASTNNDGLAVVGTESPSQLHPSRTSSQARSLSQEDGSIPSTVTTVPSIGHISGATTAPSSAPGGGVILPAPWEAAPWDMNTSSQHHTEPTSINKLLAATDPDDPDFVSPFTETEIPTGGSATRRVYKTRPDEAMTLEEKFAMARSLLVPYMVPLFLVYVAEYTMNQGVLPVVLFPLEKTPFTHLRDHYVTYSAIYQVTDLVHEESHQAIEEDIHDNIFLTA